MAKEATQDSVFTLSTPEPITNSEFMELLSFELHSHNKWYTPLYNYWTLMRAAHQSALHQSSLNFKTESATSYFISNPFLSAIDFQAFISDYFTFGTAYLRPVRSKLGNILGLEHLRTYYMRKGTKGNRFYYVNPARPSEHVELKDIIDFKNYDHLQNIYGKPSYLAALPAILLNFEATIFRIRYYQNGSHAGFILAINGKVDKDLMRKIEDNLSKTRGGGSFKNLLLHLREGTKDSVQLIPISEIAAKDEFERVKRMSERDVTAAHRIPPQFLGITPENAGGFGDPEKALRQFYNVEILPVINRLKDLNQKLGVEAFKFSEFQSE